MSMRRLWLLLGVCFVADAACASSHFLTFIMPCYNAEETVIEALDSIYKQKLTIPFEVICTDDGSVDNTRMLLIEYAQDHSEMKVFVHKMNQGGGPARNTCVAHARGDLIFNLDADNVLVQNSVQKLINLLDQTKADGAAFQEIRFFRGRFKHTHSWFYQAPNNICDLYHMMKTPVTPSSSGNYLYTKKSYVRAGGYPSAALDTQGFGFRQLATGSKIAILPKSFYWHRLADNSYFEREKAAGNLNYYGVYKQFPELYTRESYQYMCACEEQGKDLYEELLNFKLINDTAIAHIFRAYVLVEDKDFSNAQQEFEAAIHAGAVPEYVYARMKKILPHEEL